MRRPFLIALVAFAGLAAAGCSDKPVNLTGVPDSEVELLLSATPSIAELRAESDALLREPARTFARYALAKLQSDIQYQRSTVYVSSLVFAAIPLVERRLNRIPEDRIAQLIQVLCKLQELIRPHLPPSLAAIPWCDIEPTELSNEAKFQLVSNSTGGKVSSNTEQITLTVAGGNTMQDAAGNTVPSAFFSFFPLARLPGTETDAHPCPTPWDPRFAANDCYEEFYELTVQPPVQFVGTLARLEICQLDPGSGPDAPATQTVLDRLRLFSKAGNNEVSIIAQEGDEVPPIAPSTGATACEGDPDLHPTAIGPVDFNMRGMQNALLHVGRFASRAAKTFSPKLAYALNVPTHGGLERELLGLGNVVGALDPEIQATSGVVTPSSATIFVGGTTGLSAAFTDKAGNSVGERGAGWASDNTAVATVDENGNVTGVSAGTAVITATSDRAVLSAPITVDPNASFLGIWNGTITSPEEFVQPVTVIVTQQSGNTALGEFRVALPGEGVAYNDGTERFFTDGIVTGATLQFTTFREGFVGEFSFTRSRDVITGTATEVFGDLRRVWIASLTFGTEADICAPAPASCPSLLRASAGAGGNPQASVIGRGFGRP